MDISEDIRYVGVNDREIDLFEGQYAVRNGMAYNSYLILDERIAVMDSVDARFGAQWLEKLAAALAGRTPDYLVVQHMEPDHSGSIRLFMDAYPAARLVATPRAFEMMNAFFGESWAERRVAAENGGALALGRHTLTFLYAPMVHWPEVMLSYDAAEKLLFSADCFGKFGALDHEEPWDDEARRYYIGIVGKYGAQVQALLKKAAALDIRAICPLHGPVLTETIPHALRLYGLWSSYTPEEAGVTIAYTSIYGHTREAAELLAERLRAGGCRVAVWDLARADMSAAVADAFRYDRLVLATTTYNADIFPPMRDFIAHLTERNFQKRGVALIENGSWAPTAARTMRGLLEKSRELVWTEEPLRILSAPNAENRAQLERMAQALLAGRGAALSGR